MQPQSNRRCQLQSAGNPLDTLTHTHSQVESHFGHMPASKKRQSARDATQIALSFDQGQHIFGLHCPIISLSFCPPFSLPSPTPRRHSLYPAAWSSFSMAVSSIDYKSFTINWRIISKVLFSVRKLLTNSQSAIVMRCEWGGQQCGEGACGTWCSFRAWQRLTSLCWVCNAILQVKFAFCLALTPSGSTR